MGTSDVRLPTVLVAEDDGLVREITVRILTEAGYQVMQAQDGQEALALLAEHGPVELVITDVRMPRLNGYDLAARLLVESPRTLIIFTSGFDIHLGSSALPGPVLAKPFRPDQLTDCIQRVLKRPRLSA